MGKSPFDMHTHIEEVVFYPALKKRKEFKELVEEAEAQHGLVKQLLQEMKKLGEEELEKNFQAMAANVEHHVGEEEHEIFPRILSAQSELDLGQLGEELAREKERYIGSGPQSGGRSNMNRHELIRAIRDRWSA